MGKRNFDAVQARGGERKRWRADGRNKRERLNALRHAKAVQKFKKG